MASIIIRPLDDLLKRFGNQIGAVGSAKGHKALARAVNRVTNTIYGRVIRAVRKQSDIPTAIIRRSIKKRLASPKGGNIEGVIWATGKPLSLKYFRARQFRFGVKAKHGGTWHRYPSAFMGPKPGAISKKLGGHVFKRTSSGRFPIEMLFGPSVPEELVRGESERVFRTTVQDMLPVRVAHELSRMLPR
ncbi:phage tail protein [Agrobacterium salinitolerans]|uniref:Phage tail protein n=1 Tax=Agrobacterium salinitolerans TaxID=1183413 RepID=A0A4Z1RA52_9HYPH|nr:hypothetical protein [Agrobacterium salinitolerans]UYZ08568.1 phage tail protein [Agrobacterium salinitolerans]